jgi:lipopolysaccharide/colanic/teichoic acid biosynthesis glycosyltransferase
VPRPLAKRLLDLVVAGVLAIASLPLALVVVAAFAVDALVSPRDRGSLLYQEPRLSRGRAFGLLKFRTLRADVLEQAAGHARLQEAETANLTWVGRRILKPWYLDELPQLWNVLRGDISLVGPRPWPPELVARQRAEGLTYRDEVNAGLTGLAQLTKGSDRRYADLDLEYVERCRLLGSWGLVRYDLEIIVRTLAVLGRGEGLRN